MTALLGRKRSRDDDDDYANERYGRHDIIETKHDASIEHYEVAPSPSPAPVATATLKRNKTQGELEELDIVPVEEAWSIDIQSILASPTVETFSHGGQTREPHSNMERYIKGGSIVILCVQGNLQLHYDLLWYVQHPSLRLT